MTSGPEKEVRAWASDPRRRVGDDFVSSSGAMFRIIALERGIVHVVGTGFHTAHMRFEVPNPHASL